MPYSSSKLFYQPLPFEFVYTNEKTPQVIVTVDGVEAVCSSLACGFTYTQPTAKITGYTLSQGTLTITGSNIGADVQSVKFSNIACSNVVVANSVITCQVTSVAGGSWKPVVTDSNGLIPVETSAVIDVPLIVSTVSPSQSLNPMGGT